LAVVELVALEQAAPDQTACLARSPQMVVAAVEQTTPMAQMVVAVVAAVEARQAAEPVTVLLPGY
jgi:hypothetical protein